MSDELVKAEPKTLKLDINIETPVPGWYTVLSKITGEYYTDNKVCYTML